MKVKTLISQLQFAIENGYLTEDHDVIIIGQGDTETRFVADGIVLPTVILDPDKICIDKFYLLGFTSVDDYHNKNK